MKFNNNKQSFTFFTLLSFCAIATPTTTTSLEPLLRDRAVIPAVVEQSEKQERQKPFEPISKGDNEIIEEIYLDQEWEDILNNDKSGEEILLATGRGM